MILDNCWTCGAPMGGGLSRYFEDVMCLGGLRVRMCVFVGGWCM